MVTNRIRLTDTVCWTRMQAESGQDISSIISKPSDPYSVFRAEGIDVVFSLMKSRPQVRDITSSGVVGWRSYFDGQGVEQPLPEHVLVLSRASSNSGNKILPYALVCKSDSEIQLDDLGSFEPTASREFS
jgi:hypothetical protein